MVEKSRKMLIVLEEIYKEKFENKPTEHREYIVYIKKDEERLSI